MYKYISITETEDRTCCFHCGIVLGNWQEAESVWQEHAKYSSKCLYVTRIKRAGFVWNSVKFLNYETFYVLYSTMCVWVFGLC